ncbi:hypothetical protein MBRA1_003620 [Malassezia brasiliensis]|uniref:Ribosome biogenesis protein NSA1 n=1 Tax=Malassezia brasiliensis TaxID=1821822 RepID=A0AAF0DZT2_9BASI|nr:hypothetical protein MBRA1_003620 [Malassezia brasiliensis]
MAEVPEDVPDVGVYAGDSTGRLKVLHTNPKAYEQVDIQEELDNLAIKWTVPSPLHQVTFYPDTNKPRYFAYGGEQVPLSLWSLRKALERDPAQEVAASKPAEEEEQDAQAATGKKRRASSQAGKQRDLLPGELWRAKNLPNDALSLARHPLIRSVVFLPRETSSGNEEAAEDELAALDAAVAVGTKEGMVRVYEPSKKKPKHVHEWQIAAKNQGALRVLKLARSDAILFAGDAARNLYAVDVKTGRVLFQYKGAFVELTPDITGTISSLLVLQVQRDEEAPKTLLLGSSLDRLVRLFDIGTPYGQGQRRRGKELCSYFTGLENVISMTSAQLSVQAPSEKKAEEAEEEEVWANMAIARDEKDNGEESDAEEMPKEKQAKRRRSGAP